MDNGYSHSDFSENLRRCHEYVAALEEERRKIQVFRRELPLCFELITQAIETCKQQLHGHFECSEQTSSDLPVFEEFIPLKRASVDSDSEEQESKKPKNDNITACDKDCTDKNCKKSDWLRSVQLWNQSPDPPSNEDPSAKHAVSEEKGEGNGGAFHPFNKEKSAVAPAANGPLSPSSTAETGGGCKKEEKDKECPRKSRRCWSPELHRRFLHALQQLGGSHVATPKQIRELMNVDGLTNDEVKSHLQKFRLHTRRPIPSTSNDTQFVVVGGIWVPPEYAAMAAAAAAASGEERGGAATKKICAPVAASRQQQPPSANERRRIKRPSTQSDGGGGFGKRAVQSCSPASSSSAPATVSPAC